jgi:uracil phosphoribosyltransferase
MTLTTGMPAVTSELPSVQGDAASERKLQECLDTFSNVAIDRHEAQAQIAAMTREILEVRFRAFASAQVLLVPVLRAGAAMWPVANHFFGSPATAFAVAVKRKGTSETSVSLSTVSGPSRCKFVVLDPILATGDTICATSRLIAEQFPNNEIHVIGCYGSPEAVEHVSRTAKVTSLTIGVLARGVDQAGYLIPKINGDCGEKLFGKRPMN